jgi:hypothetical protein
MMQQFMNKRGIDPAAVRTLMITKPLTRPEKDRLSGLNNMSTDKIVESAWLAGAAFAVSQVMGDKYKARVSASAIERIISGANTVFKNVDLAFATDIKGLTPRKVGVTAKLRF